MLIYRCDNCGHQTEVVGIVGNEYKYHEHKWGTLAVVVDGKKDLCAPCMKKATDAFSKARREEEARQHTDAWGAVKAALA